MRIRERERVCVCVYADDDGDGPSDDAAFSELAAAASSPSGGCASVAVCDAEIGRDDDECVVTSASADSKQNQAMTNMAKYGSEFEVVKFHCRVRNHQTP